MHLVEKPARVDSIASLEIHRRRQRVQLARVLQITEKMLEYAQAGDWLSVEELEAIRKTELEACYDLQQESPSLLIAEALATLLYLNDQIVDLVKVARRKLVVHHNTMMRHQIVANIYRDELP